MTTSGSITIANHASVNNTGIYNSGTIEVKTSGVLNVDNSGNSSGILNKKALINSVGGTINVMCNSSILNEAGSTFTQDGTVNDQSCTTTTSNSSSSSSTTSRSTSSSSTSTTASTATTTTPSSSAAGQTLTRSSSATRDVSSSNHSTTGSSSESRVPTRVRTAVTSTTTPGSSSNLDDYALVVVGVLVAGIGGTYFTRKRARQSSANE